MQQAISTNIKNKLLDAFFVFSSRNALQYNGIIMSYSQLQDFVYSILLMIENNEKLIGKCIYAIYTKSPINHIASQIAVILNGSTCIPLDPNSPFSYYSNSRFKEKICVIIDDNFENSEYYPTIDLNQKKQKNIENRSLSITETPEMNGYCPYCILTSGTTGSPKAIFLKEQALLNQINAKIEILELDQKSKICISTNLSFVATIWQIFGCIFVGGCIILLSSQDNKNPTVFLNKADSYGSTLICITPSFARLLTKINRISLCNISTMVITGELLSSDIADSLVNTYAVKIVNSYGLTETSDDIFHFIFPHKFDCQTYPIVPIGYPINNIEYIIVRNNEICSSKNDIGELFISGVCLFDYEFEDIFSDHFYTINKDSQKKIFYRTGDLVSISKYGLICHGRADNQIKINGHKIVPEYIETITNKYPNIKDSIVLKIQRNNMEYLHLLYSENISGDIIPNKLREYLKSNLPSYMVPSIISKTKTIQYSNNGKKIRTPQINSTLVENKTSEHFTSKLTELDVKHIIYTSLQLDSFVSFDNVFAPNTKINDLLSSLSFVHLIVELEAVLNVEFEVDRFTSNEFETFINLSNYAYKKYIMEN